MPLDCRQIHDYIALPLIPIVQEVGLRGIPIDASARQSLLERLDIRVALLDLRLGAAKIFAPNSDAKTALDLLALGVPLTKRTESGNQFKVDAEVLGELNHKHNTLRERSGKAPRFPFLPTLLSRSRLAKARENIRALGVCRDGLLRTSLKACHTRTARYASAGFGRKGKPGFCPHCKEFGEHGTNLQNITRGCAICGSGPSQCTCDGGGVHVKSLFTAHRGWRLGEWDYAALELRVMAYRIGCAKLIDRLERGDDLHTLHATLMFSGLEITKRRRTLAKNFIYAIRGGGGNRAVQAVLAKQNEYIELSEIEGWRRAIFAEYPEIPAWIDETAAIFAAQKARSDRRVLYNAFGRPRVFLGYEPLKEGLAYEISCSAADIMNFVLLRLAYYRPEVYERIAMQIHDSFIVHAPTAEFDGCMAAVREEMERTVWHWDRAVVYPAEAKAGDRWSDLKEWKEAA